MFVLERLVPAVRIFARIHWSNGVWSFKGSRCNEPYPGAGDFLWLPVRVCLLMVFDREFNRLRLQMSIAAFSLRLHDIDGTSFQDIAVVLGHRHVDS